MPSSGTVEHEACEANPASTSRTIEMTACSAAEAYVAASESLTFETGVFESGVFE